MARKENKPLSELVGMRSRYQRSVSLVRDWQDDQRLDGYILTPSGRTLLDRIASTVSGASATRCWSVIGPYGSGKSAFALFLTKVLSADARHRATLLARLKIESEPIWSVLFGKGSGLGKSGMLLPIVVSGGRASINESLVAALHQTLTTVSASAQSRQLKKRCEELLGRQRLANYTKAIVDLFEATADKLPQLGTGYRGIVLVIDELGKFLEYAASHLGDGDIFVLQEIAELAARRSEAFLVLTVLHQSLDRYSEHLSQSRRSEWQKIQGRYEDIAFEEPASQILRLVADAIEHIGSNDENRKLESSAEKVSIGLMALASGLSGSSEGELKKLFHRCSPLHPLAALSLGPLFRRLAQNERSLFAFLTSAEPFGFQEFLATHDSGSHEIPLYRLDQLYDYVASALGPSLFAQHRGRLWAEIESALDKLRTASPLEQEVAKTVGLLQVLGYGAGMPASPAVLCAALERRDVSKDRVKEAIAALGSRSVLVYRRHADSYALWEGSDVDIDAKLREARRHVDPSHGLAAYLSTHIPLRPMVARKHSFRTGTLRYFDVRYADEHSIGSAINAPLGDADGRIVYCVSASTEERRKIEELLVSDRAACKPELLAVLPADIFDLKDACVELACLRWVSDNTPELEGDATARRELRARLAAAEQQVSRELEHCFRPGTGRQSATWYHKGQKTRLDSARKLQEWISSLCDTLYVNTPILRNELLNRRALSSSAAAARRNLIEAMIERHDKPFLGIEGTPAERSMYDCVLKVPGFHRLKDGAWEFLPPERGSDPGIRETWKAIEHFLSGCEKERRSVNVLFEVLHQAPFGLKDGVLPVLLAAALLHFDSEVALYEQGSFVPMLTTAVFERILRTPKDFEVQRCRIAGPRATVFNQYASLVAAKGEHLTGDKPRLLSVVRPLFRFVRQLPEYVSKTEQMSPIARDVLRVIREAKEPDQLLFTDLPTSCGARAFPSRGALKPKETDQFFGELRAALAELQQAYPKLQAKIEELLFKAFSLSRPIAQARAELSHRCKLVAELAVDQKLRAFLNRAMDAVSDDAVWVESIAALLANKPSTVWSDQDTARFEVVLAMTARTMGHFEALTYEMERSGAAILDGDATALRFSVTSPFGDDVERVVRIPRAMRDVAATANRGLRSALASAGVLNDPELSVAVLAELARELLAPPNASGDEKHG